MRDNLQKKRKFLVVCADVERQSAYRQRIDEHVALATTLFADDGLQALQKFENDPPHVLVIEEDLPKKSGTEVVRAILQARAEISIVFLNELPEHEEFVDQVATGQVQYLAPQRLDAEFGMVVARALNFLLQGDPFEFRVKFLAKGDVLIRRGEKADYIYFLKRGQMRASAESVELGNIESREFVGEMAYITGDARSADVVALTDCELIEIPIGHVDRLLFQKPAWSKALMQTLSRRVKSGNQQLTSG